MISNKKVVEAAKTIVDYASSRTGAKTASSARLGAITGTVR